LKKEENEKLYNEVYLLKNIAKKLKMMNIYVIVK